MKNLSKKCSLLFFSNVKSEVNCKKNEKTKRDTKQREKAKWSSDFTIRKQFKLTFDTYKNNHKI